MVSFTGEDYNSVTPNPEVVYVKTPFVHKSGIVPHL